MKFNRYRVMDKPARFAEKGNLEVLLFTLQSIMSTLIWSIGLVLIPLMIDDIILLPLWNHLWYNTYE